MTPTIYTERIREGLARIGYLGLYQPEQVEAWMRLGHDTLDGLTPLQFLREVDTACECIDAAAPGETHRLTCSYGLAVES